MALNDALSQFYLCRAGRHGCDLGLLLTLSGMNLEAQVLGYCKNVSLAVRH